MTLRSFATAAPLFAAGALAACGGTVTTSTGGDGGDSGGTSSSSTTGGTTSSSSGGAGGATGGTAGSTSSGGAGGASSCAGLDQVACLAAHPTCVPVYDDTCCSSCDPGPCADCTSLQFHHCIPHAEGCGADPAPCGLVPDWACAGGQAKCNIDPGGSPVPCGTEAGCIAGYCNLGIDCETDPVCVPVTAESCGPILCNAVPPPCPDGTTNEAQDGCFTALCLPASLCKPTQ